MRIYKFHVSKYFPQSVTLGEVLERATSLKRDVLADASLKGALWLQKSGKGKILKVRTLEVKVHSTDLVTFNYDPKILALPGLTHLDCLFENDRYGIWIKPAGVLPQGSPSSDHTSLLRYVEIYKKREVYLLHRLDRETEGLMIIGYNAEAAKKLSDLFQKNLIHKKYEAVVLGEMRPGEKITIDSPLDDKAARTHVFVREAMNGKSLLEVELETGRLHQIRRHLEFIGHPIMGDPKYGRHNKNREGLQLMARALSFDDPWTKKSLIFQLDKHLSL